MNVPALAPWLTAACLAFGSSAALAGMSAMPLANAAPAPANQVLVYTGTLSGANQVIPNQSPGTGTVKITFDLALSTMRVQASFADLAGTSTGAAIHCCTTIAGQGTAGLATTAPTFAGFPAGVTSGSYDNTFDLTMASSYTSAFIAARGGTAQAARLALLDGVASGQAYFNLRSSAYQGGEVQAFLSPVPEPGTYALMLAGLGAVGFMARRRRSA